MKIEQLIPPIGSFAEIDGARMHYVDRGTGPAILMIHGLAGTLWNFTYDVVDRLSDRARVVALDRPGSGYSTRPRGTSASLPSQAAAIARLIEHLALERPLVVGHSLGGALALALAMDHPHLVRGLALIAPLTQPSSGPPPAFRQIYIRSSFVRGLVAHTIGIPLAKRTAPQTIAAIFAPEAAPDDFAIRGGAYLGLRPSQFYHASEDVIAATDDMPAIARRYGEIALPVRVLFGRGDRVLDHRTHGEHLREQIAHAELTLTDGGHMLPVTQGARVAQWIGAL